MSKLKSKSYRLTDDRSGESFMLKTGKKGTLSVYDPEYKLPNGDKGARRAIRHCPNQKSIYIDEQDKHALVQPIIFINGYLEVSGDQPITQQFLDNHPSNDANSSDGGWFELVDDELEAREAIQDEELKMDIMYAVRQMAKKEDGIHELKAVVSVLTGSVEQTYQMGIEELKSVIYNEIDADPRYFTDEKGNVTIFDDDSIKRKYIVLRALREGVIRKSLNGRAIEWGRDKKVIATAPRSVDLVDFFAEYLQSEDGILVMDEIVRRS